MNLIRKKYQSFALFPLLAYLFIFVSSVTHYHEINYSFSSTAAVSQSKYLNTLNKDHNALNCPIQSNFNSLHNSKIFVYSYKPYIFANGIVQNYNYVFIQSKYLISSHHLRAPPSELS